VYLMTTEASIFNTSVLRELWFIGNLVQDSSLVLGRKGQLVNRPDGDYNEFAAGGVGSSEMAKTLRDRAALRGNIVV